MLDQHWNVDQLEKDSPAFIIISRSYTQQIKMISCLPVLKEEKNFPRILAAVPIPLSLLPELDLPAWWFTEVRFEIEVDGDDFADVFTGGGEDP